MSACPICGHRKTIASQTSHLQNGWTRRRRRCKGCDARWNTYELTQYELDLSSYDPADLRVVPRESTGDA